METEMTSEERNTWVYAAATVVSFAVYLAVILGRARSIPLAEVPYVAPMLWCIGGTIVASILGHVAVAIACPGDCDKKDQRDLEIHRFGEYIGQSFGALGSVAALVLSMAEVAHFWIANAVYLVCVLATLLGSAAKLVAYRRGFQSC